MSYGIIYKATNINNNKVYIGQTVKTLQQRKREHYYASSYIGNTVFHKAIIKYGEDNFKWEIIDYGETNKELDEKEILWISKYKSYVGWADSHGYNMAIGGKTNRGWKPSEEQLKRRSEINKGENNPNFGNVGELAPMYGKKHSDESRMKMSQNRKGSKRTDEMKKRDRDVKIGVYSNEKNPRARAVVKLSKDGLFIEIFPTAKQGAESVNGKRSAITNCCNGASITSYGFKWMYADEYNGDIQAS